MCASAEAHMAHEASPLPRPLAPAPFEPTLIATPGPASCSLNLLPGPGVPTHPPGVTVLLPPRASRPPPAAAGTLRPAAALPVAPVAGRLARENQTTWWGNDTCAQRKMRTDQSEVTEVFCARSRAAVREPALLPTSHATPCSAMCAHVAACLRPLLTMRHCPSATHAAPAWAWWHVYTWRQLVKATEPPPPRKATQAASSCHRTVPQ